MRGVSEVELIQCPCSQPMPVPGAFPKAAGRATIDRVALRRELGAVAELREAMTHKLAGRSTANVGVIWQVMTKAAYKSGDLPWLAARGCAQNALLFGAPHKRAFTWKLHTRDYLAVATGMNEDVKMYSAEPRQGTRLELADVDPDLIRYWDRARGVYVGMEDRLRELLAANDIPGFTFRFNGVEVKPMFSRRGGSRVAVNGSWGDGTSADVKAYRRPPGDRCGAYYLRLNGLLQVVMPAQRGGLKADVVVDLSTRVRPGQRGYPFNAARDALQDTAAWTFAALVEEVERENESVGRSQEDTFIDPEGDADDDAGGDIADQMAEAFADADVRRAIAEVAGGIADFYRDQAKYGAVEAPVASLAPRGTKAVADGDAPERGWVLPAGIEAAGAAVRVEGDIDDPSDVAAARALRAVLVEADEAGRTAGGGRTVIVTEQVEQALRRAEAGQDLDGWQSQAVEAAIDRAAEAALAPGGGGLIQAVAVSKAKGALDALTPAWAKQLDRAEGRRVRNPFGKFAGIRISKKSYSADRARRFRKNYAKWVPYLLSWDGALRLVASEARIRRSFRPGFVLYDSVVAEAIERAGGRRFLFIHPDRFAQVVRAHRERPLAIAVFLHQTCAHGSATSMEKWGMDTAKSGLPVGKISEPRPRTGSRRSPCWWRSCCAFPNRRGTPPGAWPGWSGSSPSSARARRRRSARWRR